MKSFITGLPKAELHLHIEGTFEPELMFKIAKINKKKIKYKSVKELKAAYDFSNLQDFLNIYYEGAGVLIKEKDFYDMTFAYLKKAYSQGVLHAEIFFDPQTHTKRGIEFKTVINGIHKACADAKKKFSMSTKLIMCFLRDLTAEDAMNTLEQARPFKKWITAVGLDSAEVGNPPSKFKTVYEKALKEGFLTVAHAGEEGPAQYVWDSINLLKVSRVDHGNHSLDDEKLVKFLVQKKIPLTVCPLSNVKLRVVSDIKKHPLKKMMDKGLFVTINSDDPAYFRGYVADNYIAVQKALNLRKEDIFTLAKNSFNASFLKKEEKKKFIAKLNEYINKTKQS